MAAEEFTRRGYHSTRVEHIAERLDLSPGALYRHVPGKYEMFRDAVAVLVSELEAATTAGVGPVAGEGDALGRLVESITLATLAHRSRAALYRWQARYLGPEDRAAVVAADARVRGRLAAAVRGRRRGGDSLERKPRQVLRRTLTRQLTDVGPPGAGAATRPREQAAGPAGSVV